MDKPIDISVVVLSYNSALPGMLLTLGSIIRQQGVSFEIVLADDGSSQNNFAAIEEFFAKEGFAEFSLVANAVNKGTVANIVSGLAVCRGEYCKLIGAGDLLYAPDTLQKLCRSMRAQNAVFGFGRLCAYHMEHSGQPVQDRFYAPRYLKPYLRKNAKAIEKAMLRYDNWISGASMVYKTDFIGEKLEKLARTVRYCEDLIQYTLLVEGYQLHYLDYPVVLYEYGSGISTAGSGANKRMLDDHIAFFTEQIKAGVGNRDMLAKKLETLTAPSGGRMLQILRNPHYLKWLVVKRLGGGKDDMISQSFLADPGWIERYKV